jgi:phosphoserine phosphatase
MTPGKPVFITHVRARTRESRAMGGTMDFKSALRMRLDVMQPSRAAVEDFLAKHPHRITPGMTT